MCTLTTTRFWKTAGRLARYYGKCCSVLSNLPPVFRQSQTMTQVLVLRNKWLIVCAVVSFGQLGLRGRDLCDFGWGKKSVSTGPVHWVALRAAVHWAQNGKRKGSEQSCHITQVFWVGVLWSGSKSKTGRLRERKAELSRGHGGG